VADAVDVVLVNAPASEARHIARALVDEELAACVNVLPGVTSIYRWDGKVHEDAEVTLVIKTRRSLVRDLTARVKALHSYSVPEVIALPVASDRGNADYLRWVVGETHSPATSTDSTGSSSGGECGRGGA
jgi:periplasmic divalent cation tolerance protein